MGCMGQDMTCEKCGLTLDIGDYPFCPHEKGSGFRGHDEIPGGLWIENLGPHPIKVYSHSERLRLAKARGLTEFVRHTPVPGTNGSPYTTNWGAVIDPYTMRMAEELVARVTGGVSSPEEARLEREGVQFDNVKPFSEVVTTASGTGVSAAEIEEFIHGK